MNTGHLSFTGRTGCYAELPLDVLAGATTFTIEIKFATTSTKSGGNSWNWGTIAGREIGSFGKDDWALCVNGGKLCFWCSPASKGTAATNTQILTPTTIVNDGAIHKAAVVSSGGAVYLYAGSSMTLTDGERRQFCMPSTPMEAPICKWTCTRRDSGTLQRRLMKFGAPSTAGLRACRVGTCRLPTG